MLRSPRIWIYLFVGLAAAGLIAYNSWHNSDEKRLQRCTDATIAQMKQDAPALERFDNAQTGFGRDGAVELRTPAGDRPAALGARVSAPAPWWW